MPLRAGNRLGPYEITASLGAGGMGEVYRARDTRLARDVAIKVLPATRSGNRDAEARFDREARAIAAVNHTNICTVHDVGNHDGRSFLVLELLQGESLHERLARGPFDVASLVDHAIALSDALDTAHVRGLLHRDLKPANVFLTTGGQVKILDFGLAKVLESPDDETRAPEAALTEGGTAVGTVGYMPPEQLRGEPIDARADLFALGALLYEMATGQRAFQGRTAAVVADAVLNRTPTTPTRLRPDLPAALDAVIMSALEKDRDVRCQSASDLRAQLRRVKREISGPSNPPAPQPAPAAVSPRVSSAAPSPPAPHPISSDAAVAAGLAKRHPAFVAVAVLAVAAVIGAGWWWQTPAETPAPVTAEAPSTATSSATAANTIAVLPFSDLSPGKDQEYFSDGLAEEVLNQLTRVPELQVIARTSSFSFKGQADDVRTIAEKLGVAHVLQGSVRKAGDRLRVTTQLIRADTGIQIWSENYDRELEDVFEVQDEIASRVVAALQLRLSTRQPVSPAARPANVDAYAQYLIGRQAYLPLTPDSLKRAAAAFRQAIALDPNYGAAHAELAMSVFSLADATNDKAGFGPALAAAEKAVALTPDGTTYGVRGYLRAVVAWDWAGAVADLDRAVALNPGDSLVRVRHFTVLGGVGRAADSAAAGLKAFELDPLSEFARSAAGLGLMRTGRLQEARVMFTSPPGGPPLPGRLGNLGIVLLEMGQAAEALETFRGLPAGGAVRLRGIAAAQHTLGRARESQEALSELIDRHARTSPLIIASVYAWRGETDQAFLWIDRAIRERDTLIPRGFRAIAIFDSLRRDPRYPALLKRLGFPD